MTIATYDVTATEVLYHLPQFVVSGDLVPDRDVITSHWIPRAAVDIANALKDGGFGLEPNVSSSTNEYAYTDIRNALIERAALYFATANRNNFSSDEVDRAWKQNNAILLKYSQGDPICELEPEAGYKSTKFYIGTTDTVNDLDDVRFSYLNDKL